MKLRSKVVSARSSRWAAPVAAIDFGHLQLERQVAVGDPVVAAGGDQPLDQVLELADVARPPVVLQHRQRRGGEALHVLAEPAVVAGEEELHQVGQVLDALAQRRDADRDDVDAVEQVLAERALAHAALEVDVGGGDQPELHLDRLAAADPLDLALLDGAQQLGLEVELQVADLVEEQRAAVGQLELADLLAHRAGERALLVAEQRALDQLAGDGGDVHRDERPVGRLGVAVDHPRHQLLAGAALAADQHGGRQRGHLVHLLEHLARGRARPADEIAVALFLLHLRGQRQHLPVEVLPFRGVRDDRAHRLGLGALDQHVVGAELHRLHRQVDVGRVGEHHELGQRVVLADDAQEVEAADSRQRRVRQHQVDAVAAEHAERAPRRSRRAARGRRA